MASLNLNIFDNWFSADSDDIYVLNGGNGSLLESEGYDANVILSSSAALII